jgi:hypothetical protein
MGFRNFLYREITSLPRIIPPTQNDISPRTARTVEIVTLMPVEKGTNGMSRIRPYKTNDNTTRPIPDFLSLTECCLFDI